MHCRDDEGLLLGETKQKIIGWAQYFGKFLNKGRKRGQTNKEYVIRKKLRNPERKK